MTSDEWFIAINKTKMINEALGGPFIAPWEIDQVPDEVVERIVALNEDLPGMREGQQKVEEIREKFLREMKLK